MLAYTTAEEIAKRYGAESWAALNGQTLATLIAVEDRFARVEGYRDNVRAHVGRLGYFPASILHVKPQSAIEAVAMCLTTEAIQQVPIGDDA